MVKDVSSSMKKKFEELKKENSSLKDKLGISDRKFSKDSDITKQDAAYECYRFAKKARNAGIIGVIGVLLVYGVSLFNSFVSLIFTGLTLGICGFYFITSQQKVNYFIEKYEITDFSIFNMLKEMKAQNKMRGR